MTTHQLAKLIETTGLTQSEVVSTAIDRMFQQETKTMISNRQNQIGVVHVLSEGEQISFIMTGKGSFVVGCIPDATIDTLDDVPILKKVNSLDEAEAWFNKQFGI